MAKSTGALRCCRRLGSSTPDLSGHTTMYRRFNQGKDVALHALTPAFSPGQQRNATGLSQLLSEWSRPLQAGALPASGRSCGELGSRLQRA